MNFLSREIVFLFPNDNIDTNSIFEKLLKSSSNCEIPYGVPNNILAALNIEIPGKNCNYLDSFIFKYEGDQARPYLDLLNTLTKISDFHGLNVRFDDHNSHNIPIIADSMIRQVFSSNKYVHTSLLK